MTRTLAANKQLTLLALLISLVFLAGCSTSVTTSGAFTEDIEGYEELCAGSQADTCLQAVAQYNQDPEICKQIQEQENREDCERTITQGTLTHREYTTGTGCSYDSRPFGQTCEEACTQEGLTYEDELRQTLEDPIPPSSVFGHLKCENLNKTIIMTCYCY